MWPVKTMGRPGMYMLHMCVDITVCPSARATLRGQSVRLLLVTGVPSMMKICIVPESAIAFFANVGIAVLAKSMVSGGDITSRGDTFEATTVSISLSGSKAVSIHIWAGYDKSVT